MTTDRKIDRIAKKFLLYFFSGLALMVVLIVAFDDDSKAIEKESNVLPIKKEISTSYTPCECADISYKVLKIGGVGNASAADVTALDICNKKSANEVFLTKQKDCESYKRMLNQWK